MDHSNSREGVLQAETDALRAELADTSLAERLRAAEEALAAQRAEGHAALAAAATARAEAADAKREAAAVQTRAAAAQRAAEEASAEAGRKATAAEEVRAGAEARIARAETAAADTADTLKIKKAMLASAAEQVAELKVELDEALQCAAMGLNACPSFINALYILSAAVGWCGYPSRACLLPGRTVVPFPEVLSLLV